MFFRTVLSFLLFQVFLSSLLIVPQAGKAQDVYQLKYKTDIPIGSVGLGSLTASYLISRKHEPPTPEQIQSLKREDIWKLDRSATRYWSPPCAKASDALLFTSFAVPGFLLVNSNVRDEYGDVGLMYAETLVLTAGMTNLVKQLSHRYRPYAYNENVSMEEKLKKDTRVSFFSGHTSFAASTSFFMAKVYTDLNPGSKLNPLVWTSAAVLPAIVGFLRYRAGKHYPSDVIVGYIAGALAGFFVPYIHQRKEFRP